MRFWTFQRNELIQELLNNGKLEPDFSIDKKITGLSILAYRKILETYNNINKTSYKGLIFGYDGTEVNYRNNFKNVIETWKEVGEPGGAIFNDENHLLLELEIPSNENIAVLRVDFYRFSDLLYYYKYPNELEDDGLTIENIENTLYLPNISTEFNSTKFEFPIGHIPFIKKEWISKIYTTEEIQKLIN
ncbi:MAG: hypothetical protein IJ593_10670 [Lachnospiraceae bacterium]|nr:hypothetical protein [Lachnospiraceae bacterium]